MITSSVPRSHGRRLIGPFLRILGLILGSTGLSSCSHQVSVPAAANDQPPHITINGYVIGGTGTVSQDNVSSTQSVQVSLGAELQFTVTAANPGGVQSLSYVFTHGTRTTAVGTSATPDTDGKVLDQLTILGTDGAGNPGNTPVILAETPATSTVPIPASMSVTATNFNGMTTSILVTYIPTWQAPQIVSFTATPDYINIGSLSKLSWQIHGCYAYCQVRVEGRDGLGFKDLVESHPNQSAFGSLDVHPTRSTHTLYTLTAENPQASTASPKTVTVQLAPAPPKPGQVFFFKMTRPGGVTPCFTMAIYAPDPSTAKQWAEGQNGGYSATSITETQYYAGC
jgi:hypothetical protein